MTRELRVEEESSLVSSGHMNSEVELEVGINAAASTSTHVCQRRHAFMSYETTAIHPGIIEA